MGEKTPSVTPEDLIPVIGTGACPRIVDVRRAEAFAAATEMIPGAIWHDHRDAEAWGRTLRGGGEPVVYCVHGHQVSQSAAALLRSLGVGARYLAGGIEAYREAGGTLIKRSAGVRDRSDGRSHWVATVGADLDGLARAWFIRRFLDPAAVLHFVEADWVAEVAAELRGQPIRPEAPDQGDGYRLHDFFLRYSLGDGALQDLAGIVETAGRDCGDARQAGIGLSTVIEGLAVVYGDDAARVSATLPVFDALYAGCRRRAQEGTAREGS